MNWYSAFHAAATVFVTIVCLVLARKVRRMGSKIAARETFVRFLMAAHRSMHGGCGICVKAAVDSVMSVPPLGAGVEGIRSLVDEQEKKL